MNRYAIADYLSPEQVARALAHTYGRRPDNFFPYDEDGYCPLGRALEGRFTPLGEEAPRFRRPLAGEVAEVLAGDPWDAVRSLADQFIDAWETGRIADLAEALGVTDGGAE